MDLEESKIWKPNPGPQEDFISLPFSIFEGLYGGAAFGGKSEVLLMLPLIYGFHQYSQYVGITFRRTFPELEKSLILKAKNIYRHTGAVYNENKHSFTWPSGATHFFSYLETLDQAKEHDTNEYNLIEFDELTHFEADEYFYLTSRCRTSSNLPAILRNASNPGNRGHHWVLDHFVAPAPKGRKIIYDERTKTSRIFIQAKATDNPVGMAKDPGYYDRLELLPEADRKAKRDGDWFAFEGQVFSEFSLEKHVVDPFKVPIWWPKVCAIDWGYTAWTAAYLGAVDPEINRLYVMDGFRVRKTKIAIWANELQYRYQFVGNLVGKVIDPSATIERGDPKNIHQQVIEATGWNDLRLASNARIAGKNMIHEFLRIEQRPQKRATQFGFDPEIYGFLLRSEGLESAQKYESYFIEDPPELNLPKCQIFSNLTELIKTITTRTYDDRRPEDVAETKDDDDYDAYRYLCMEADRFLNYDDGESVLRKQKQRVIGSFEQTQDWNALFRRMEKLEAESKSIKICNPNAYQGN